jgi:hypothetical protein
MAMYQRYWGGNMDEGWTRLVLEKFDFPYQSLFDAEIEKGNLNAKYDVIVLPHDSTAAITGERAGRSGGRAASYPPQYRSGLGMDAVGSLKAFVEKGGTLVALGGASDFAIEKLGLHVRNIMTDVSSDDFFCPGSTLKATVANLHPLAYGMPSECLVLFYSSPVFEVLPGTHSKDYDVIVRYAGEDILGSGWLIGEKRIAGKGGMIEADYGKGRVVLIGFRPQHRSQTHGTFKLFFNALLN